MLKKLFLLTLAALTLAACNDDDDEIRFARQNTAIENGRLTGTNMHFYGTLTVVGADGKTHTDKGIRFETAGLRELMLYMHRVRLNTDMKRVEALLPDLVYTPAGDNGLTFRATNVTPKVYEADRGYQPVEGYPVTDLEGSIDGLDCRVGFTCAGTYRITYEGKLIIY